MIIRDDTGALVLTVASGDAPVDGYLTTDYVESGRSYRRLTVSATRVDGEHEVARAANNVRITWRVFIEGSSLAQVRERYDALLDAVEQDQWQLDVFGDATTLVWFCTAADSVPTFYPGGLAREVELTFSALPGRGY